MDAFVKKIGRMVRFHRKKAGLTQKDLGTLADVGKTVVYDVEKGKSTVRLSTLLALLHVLNIHLEFQSPLMHRFDEHEKS